MITAAEIKLAEKVAWRVGSKWQAVEIDDLQSHLYLFMAENVKHLVRWRDEPGDNGKLYVALRREAARYCAKEQAARVGRPINFNVRYEKRRPCRASLQIISSGSSSLWM